MFTTKEELTAGLDDVNSRGYFTRCRTKTHVASERDAVHSGLRIDLQYPWVIKIAVFPERLNLIRAAKAVAPVLIKHDLSFKCLTLPQETKTGSDVAIGDGTLTGDDRDLRGKEICIAIHYDSEEEQYELSTAQIKKILLECWRNLNANNVTLGYLTPGRDEKSIQTSYGDISPFVYSVAIPAFERHGNLHANNYNAYDFPDPLAGLIFTEKDLTGNNININEKEVAFRRFAYQKEHFEMARAAIIKEIRELISGCDREARFSEIIVEFEKVASADDLNTILNNDVLINTLSHRIPLVPGGIPTESQEIMRLRGMAEENKAEEGKANLDEFKSLIGKIKVDYEKLNSHQINFLIDEFKNDPFIHDLFDSIEHYRAIDSLVYTRPAEMLRLYRQLVHLRHEHEKILEESHRLNGEIAKGKNGEKCLSYLINQTSKISYSTYIRFLKNSCIDLCFAERLLLLPFVSLFYSVNDYVKSGGKSDEVIEFYDFLIQQVGTWLENPPADCSYVRNVLRFICTYDLQSNQKRLHTIKGRLAYIKGLIHLNGFNDEIKANRNQALTCFKDARKYGYDKVYGHLGQMYFDAMLEEDSEDYPESLNYRHALEAFEQGFPNTCDKLYSLIKTRSEQLIASGKLQEAFDFLQTYEAYYRLRGVDDNITTNIRAKLNYLSDMISMVDVATTLSSHFLKVDSGAVENLEANYLSIKGRVKVDNNPAFDYYHFKILSSISRLQPDTALGKDAAKRADELANKLLSKNKYTTMAAKTLLLYVYGLASYDSYTCITDKLEINDQITLFKTAAESGCYLALSYIANKYEGDDDQVNAGRYYALSAKTGDPRAQMVYFERFLNAQLACAKKDNDIRAIIQICERSLLLLNSALSNPYMIEESKPVIQERIKFMMEQLDGNTIKLPMFIEDYWEQFKGDRFVKIKKIFSEYHKLASDQLEGKLYQLQNIYSLLKKEMKENSELLNRDLLKKALQQLVISIDYLKEQISTSRLSVLVSMSPEGRIMRALEFYSQPGHIDHEYYLEHTDPKHRKVEEIERLWKTSTYADRPFVDFLFYSNPSTFDFSVIYFTQFERERFIVEMNEADQLLFSKSQKTIPDGIYLYVLDPESNFYLLDYDKYSKPEEHRYVQHTSLLNGKPSICAGEVVVENGKITHINNISGHYRPSCLQILEAVTKLLFKGLLKKDEFTIGIFPDDDVPGLEGKMKSLTLDEFLSNIDKIYEREQACRDDRQKAFAAVAHRESLGDPDESTGKAIVEYQDPKVIGRIEQYISAKDKIPVPREKQEMKKDRFRLFSKSKHDGKETQAIVEYARRTENYLVMN